MVKFMTSNSRARVELTLEISITDNWTDDATVEQIHKQAIESAKQKLNEVLRGAVRIIDNPKVTMILVDKK
jgi:hypothetical protein